MVWMEQMEKRTRPQCWCIVLLSGGLTRIKKKEKNKYVNNCWDAYSPPHSVSDLCLQAWDRYCHFQDLLFIWLPLRSPSQRSGQQEALVLVLFFFVCLFVLLCSDYFTQSATRSGWCWYDRRRPQNTRSVWGVAAREAAFLHVLYFRHFPALLCPVSSCFLELKERLFTDSQSGVWSFPALSFLRLQEKRKKNIDKSTRKVSCLCECVCVCERKGIRSCICVDVCASAELEKKISLSTGATSS